MHNPSRFTPEMEAPFISCNLLFLLVMANHKQGIVTPVAVLPVNIRKPSAQVSSSQFNEGTTTFTTPELPIPRDMSNKNKKKGFLREMAGLRGKKTVFHADTDGVSASLPDIATEVDQSPSSAFPLGGSGNHLQSQQNLFQGDWTLDGIFHEDAVDGDNQRHLNFSTSTPLRSLRNIPPSELTSLPDNVFVTRTEFGDSWYGKSNLARDNGHGNSEKSPANQQWGVAEEEAEFAGEYGAEGEAHDGGTETMAMAMDKVFWESTEKNYDDLKFLDEGSLSQLGFGSILARKELVLDLHTYSPQLQLNLVKVISVTTEGILIEKMDSPIFAEEEKEEETEGQVSPQEECGHMKLDRDEMKSGNWKIVF
ncbi:hypothetical protein C358_02709 [Cryptococcus neoformans MW-RSA852]|nr:hypothetical protein C358_02709 [Cryptococcus neoformans var. grubii MW-RSA852]